MVCLLLVKSAKRFLPRLCYNQCPLNRSVTILIVLLSLLDKSFINYGFCSAMDYFDHMDLFFCDFSHHSFLCMYLFMNFIEWDLIISKEGQTPRMYFVELHLVSSSTASCRLTPEELANIDLDQC